MALTYYRPRQDDVLCAVGEERDRQDDKWGWIGDDRSIVPGDNEYAKLAVLMEEVGEVAKALLEGEPKRDLHEELIQVAAVAVAWVEADWEKGRI